MLDGRALINAGETLVFCVDEYPFPAKNNHFCVLYPLMTLDGKRLDPNPQSFPNRSRVWWMVRDDHVQSIEPGSIWIAQLQEAKGWAPTDPKSDQYEIRWDTVRQDHNVVEILDFDAEEPDLGFIYEERSLSWPRRPASRVFLRGQEVVVGPFRSEWDAQTKELNLTLRSGAAQALRMPRPFFDEIAPSHTFVHTVNAYDKSRRNETHEITLVARAELDMSQLRREATEVDCRTDQDIVRTAVRQASFSRSERSEIKSLLNKLEKANLQDDISQRLRRINMNVISASERAHEVSAYLAETPVFRDLIQAHIDATTAGRVRDEVARRERQIEEELASLDATRKKVKRDIDSLRKQYETKLRQQERDIKQAQEKQIRALDERQKTLELREQEVVQKESEFVDRLDRMTNEYRNQASRIGDEVLLQFPIIERLLQGRSPAPQEAEPQAQEAPDWHATAARRKKSRSKLSEHDFVEQFTDVTRQRGFVFDREDLVHYHVSMKSAPMTIITGGPGTGKTSLPRLYAEALGARDEFSCIPVRPDWLDDRDLLGAFNPLSRRFEPGASGLVDQLISASLEFQNGNEGIYTILFDEMNLARVEHYFSQFLSVLDSPVDQRAITLFPAGTTRESDPYNAHRLLRLGMNVRFVGTANLDETTHFFTPKVLDRVQIVSLRSPDLEQVQEASDLIDIAGLEPVSYKTWSSWVKSPAANSAARSLLVRVDAALRQAGAPINGRRFNQILRYISSAGEFMNEFEALDIQLRQRVLPGLERNSSRFEECVQQLDSLLPAAKLPRSSALLHRIAESHGESSFFQYL